MMLALQKKVNKVTRLFGLVDTPELCCLDLCSEVGELAKEILSSTDYGKTPAKSRKEIEEEIGDVFYSLICLANTQKIDLKKALINTLKKYEKRYQKRGK